MARGPPRTPLWAGDWAKPRSPGRQEESARWRQCLHTWRPPGTCQRAESCGYLGYSQLCVVCVVPETRARYLLFHFFPLGDSSREGRGSKEKEKKEEVKLCQTRICPLLFPPKVPKESGLCLPSPGPVQSPPPRSLSNTLDFIVCLPHKGAYEHLCQLTSFLCLGSSMAPTFFRVKAKVLTTVHKALQDLAPLPSPSSLLPPPTCSLPPVTMASWLFLGYLSVE